MRQLKDAAGSLRLEASFAGSRHTASFLLEECREKPEKLLLEGDHKREPRSFTVALTKEMGRNKGRGDSSFVRVTERQLFDFYRDIVQNLTPWTAKAPRIRESAPEETGEQAPPDPDQTETAVAE